MKSLPKNIIVLVGTAQKPIVDGIKMYEKSTKNKFRICLLRDGKSKKEPTLDKHKSNIDIIISCDMDDPSSIQRALLPYKDQLFSITARGEYNISLLARAIPHVPYIKTPTSESLVWATDKLLMRKRINIHNKKINPKYTIVTDTSKKSLKKIEEKVGFPLITKPTGLAASQFVSICFHKEELEAVLKKMFKKVQNASNKKKTNKEQKILVEQFMEGDMYSIDAYVTSRGKVYFCPMVQVKTGNSIGFDDFFGYRRITPTLLKTQSIENAQSVAKEAINALALRSTSTHIELMKMEDTWKIIELSPRTGGFRHNLYQHSFGINHTMNDILIHAGKKPVIPRKRKGYAVAMQFFAKKEGRLTKLKGIIKAQELKSFKSIKINKKIGDMCTYAKNGGSSVFNIVMFNKDRSKLLADVRRLEQMTTIETKNKK